MTPATRLDRQTRSASVGDRAPRRSARATPPPPPARPRRGRPSRLEPTTEAIILEALRGGCTKADAANVAGIGPATLYRWLADRRPEFREFRDAVTRAQACARGTAVSSLLKGRSTRGTIAWLRLYGGPEWRTGCRHCPMRASGQRYPLRDPADVGRRPVVTDVPITDPHKARWGPGIRIITDPDLIARIVPPDIAAEARRRQEAARLRQRGSAGS